MRKLISGPRARHMRGLFCSCTVVIGSPVRPFVASWPLACLDTGHWPPAISGVRRPQAVRKRPEALASRYHAWYSRRWRTLASANGAQVEPLACPVSATSTLKGRYDYGPPHNPGNEGLSVFVFFCFVIFLPCHFSSFILASLSSSVFLPLTFSPPPPQRSPQREWDVLQHTLSVLCPACNLHQGEIKV